MRYWLSWTGSSEKPEIEPEKELLGVWKNGKDKGIPILVALVDGKNREDAEERMERHFPGFKEFEQHFFDRVPDGWIPSKKFPL